MNRRRVRPVFRNPFRRNALRQEVDEEFAFHLEERARALESDGLDPATARREALAQFGDRRHWQASSLRERRRAWVGMQGARTLRSAVTDLHEAARRLARRPLFAGVSALVLAAGTGSSIAVVAIIDATMLRPLPFEEPDRVVRLYATALPRFTNTGLAAGHYFDIKNGATSFSSLSTTIQASRTIFLDGPRRFPVLFVESDFFDVVGIEPALGRRILPQDEAPDAEPVAVITHDFWHEQLAGDPSALGTTLRLGDGFLTVVGIMPEEFAFPLARRPMLFLPYRGDRTYRAWTDVHQPLGRLRDGTSVDVADREAKAIAARLAEAYPEATHEAGSGLVMSAVVQPFREDFFWDPTGRVFLLVVGLATALLLAMSCLNASGLLIAHTLARRREMSVRAALGAGRWRLARSVMAETGLLTVVGLAGGVLLGRLLLQAIQATSPWVPLLDTAVVDGRVLLGTALLGLLVWLVAGLAPALLGSRHTLIAVLKESSRTSSHPVHWARRANIVTQFAVSCALMTGAAVAVQGYAGLAGADVGFEERGVAALQLVLPRARYGEPSTESGEPGVRVLPDARDFTRRVMDRLREVPGVTAVAAGTSHPFERYAWTGYFHEDLVDESIPFREKRQHRTLWVTPGYFETLAIPLLEGRFLQDADDDGAPTVVVVNRSFADSLRKVGAEPVGSTIRLHPLVSSPAVDAQVVGVVANTILKQSADAHDPPAVYLPFAQQGAVWAPDLWSGVGARTFVVRIESGDAAALLPDLQRTVWSVDPEVPFGEVRTLSDIRAEQFRFARFILLILGGFAGFAVVLAGVATFALLAQAVRSRVHEIGIRRALGSSRGGVARRFVREGLHTAGLGTLLGVAGALGIDFVLRGQLRTAPWADALAVEQGWSPGLQVAVVVVLATVAVLGSWGPAWVASRVDPLDAIRSD